MPVRYATLDLVERDFNAGGGNAAGPESMFIYLDFASRRVEEFCDRRFDQRVETRRYDALGRHIPAPNVMHLDEDLLELTAITNGDGTEIDIAPIILSPYNAYPKSQIILAPTDAWAYEDTPYAAIQVSGVWGFHRKPSRAWQSAGVTVPEGGLAEDAASLTLEGSAGAILRGHVLKIGGEQMSVETLEGAALGLERGLNGTDAAAHDAGAAISIYAPEETIQRATARIARWMYAQREAPFEKIVTPEGIAVIPPGIPNDVAAMLRQGEFVRKKSAGVLYAV